MTKRILVPFGTRPEIIKLAPVVSALTKAGFQVRKLATGQHYDQNMAGEFFTGLHLRPDEQWSLEGDEAQRVGSMLAHAYGELEANRPDLVLVLGDTHTVPLFCLAARRHNVPLAHLEAGLRSFNPTSMEETNRRIAAVCCSLHFAPTEMSANFLESEGCERSRIQVVGNSIIDALRQAGAAPRPASDRYGVVLTAHRPTNVDNPVRLRALVDIAGELVKRFGAVRFPVHPRTRLKLASAGLLDQLAARGVEIMPPLDYRRMLEQLSTARLVVTDSGGLQEEAAWLKVPAVVLRNTTPRWESVVQGSAILAGMNSDEVLRAALALGSAENLRKMAGLPCPYGDGFTGDRVAKILRDPTAWNLLKLEEPEHHQLPQLHFGRPPVDLSPLGG